MKVLIIHGPNLNMLGYRDPVHYGHLTFESLIEYIKEQFETEFEDPVLTFYQSNSEGKLIDAIQESIRKEYDAILLNLGAYSHYSIALHDALEMSSALKVEVHLSDVHNREAFRQTLMTASACDKVFSGEKERSYHQAIRFIKNTIEGDKE